MDLLNFKELMKPGDLRNRAILLIAVALIAYLLLPKYEMIPYGNSYGSIVRLNRVTGSVSVCIPRSDRHEYDCTISGGGWFD